MANDRNLDAALDDEELATIICCKDHLMMALALLDRLTPEQGRALERFCAAHELALPR